MLDRLLERLPAEPRRTLVLLGALALAAALFRFPGLGYPAEEYFDEVYHAKTALQYLRGEPPTEWVHPPTAKLLIAVGVALFGYEPWAWRLAPALAGTLLAPVFFLLARRVLATERAALLATLLLLLDGVYLVQSRVAMTNVFAVLFQLLSALLLVRAATADRLALGSMAAAGVALGLALSTRWTSLFAWGFLGLVFLAPCAAPGGPCRPSPRGGARGPRLRRSFPLAVYVLSYVPWMRQGHTPWEAVALQKAIWRLPRGPRPPPTPTSAGGGPGPGSTGPLGTSGGRAAGGCAASWPSATRRSGGRRSRVSAWAVATGVRWRDPRRVFAGSRLLPAVPALGPLAAHAQLQPLPLRGHPLRVPRPRDPPRPRLGRPPPPPPPGLRRARGRALPPLPAAPHRDPDPTSLWGFRFPGWRRDLDLVPELDLSAPVAL